jgi:putative DNA primase/helicase
VLYVTNHELELEARPNGRARTPVIITSGATDLVTDEVNLASEDARRAVLMRVPEGTRDDVERLLCCAARELIRRQPRQSDEAQPQGKPVTFYDPEAWPEAVSGADLLDIVVSTYRRFGALPEGAAEAMALWVLHTYAHDAAQVSPVLAFLSPEKRCGKTTMLNVTGALVYRPLPSSNLTPAVVFRVIAAFKPTLLIDEADTFIHDNSELRGVLNSAHTRAGQVLRAVPKGDDFEVRSFSTWCPKAIAAIRKLPNTLMDRSIVIPMRRRLPSETVEALRLDRLPTELEPIRRKLRRWATDNQDKLSVADPTIPHHLQDRAADNWRPLLAIADLAGGDWPAKARRAALSLSRTFDDEAPAILLLGDMRGLFLSRHRERLSSAEFTAALADMVERPWAEWNRVRPISQQQIAKLLAPFGIRPKMQRTSRTYSPSGALLEEGSNARGYSWADCEEAFSRYLPPSDGEDSSTESCPAESTAGCDVEQHGVEADDAVPVASEDDEMPF